MKRRELFPLAAGIVAGTALAPRLAGAADKKSLVLVTNASADFWTIARRGIEKAQKELPNYDLRDPGDLARRRRPSSGGCWTTC